MAKMQKTEFLQRQREVLEKIVRPEFLDKWSQDSVIKLLAANRVPEDMRNHVELTDEEITYIMPFQNGMLPSAERRMSKMAVCKLEKKALAKLRKELAKYGINKLDDAIDTSRLRGFATEDMDLS